MKRYPLPKHGKMLSPYERNHILSLHLDKIEYLAFPVQFGWLKPAAPTFLSFTNYSDWGWEPPLCWMGLNKDYIAT